MAEVAQLLVFHFKHEFIQKALELDHPFDNASAIDDNTRRNIFELLTKGLSSVAQRRIDAGKRVRQMGVFLFGASCLGDQFSGPVSWGVDGRGGNCGTTKSQLYPWKEVPATSSPQDLLASAVWRRAFVLERAQGF